MLLTPTLVITKRTPLPDLPPGKDPWKEFLEKQKKKESPPPPRSPRHVASAVLMGLIWLKNHQEENRSWSFSISNTIA